MMGAVRVKIQLKNAIDEELVNRGLLAPNLLRQLEIEGLVDTGAVGLVIPQRVVEELGLRIRGEKIFQRKNGSKESIGTTEAIIIEYEGRETVNEALVVGNEVLIGRVILAKLDLLVDCKNQRLIPNPEHRDYPVAMIKGFRSFGKL